MSLQALLTIILCIYVLAWAYVFNAQDFCHENNDGNLICYKVKK